MRAAYVAMGLVFIAGVSAADETVLHPAYPNPFNPTTVIPFELGADTSVEIGIFATSGKRIRTLVDGQSRAGRHEVWWNGTDARGRAVPGGIYFCRLLTSSGERRTIRLILLK